MSDDQNQKPVPESTDESDGKTPVEGQPGASPETVASSVGDSAAASGPTTGSVPIEGSGSTETRGSEPASVPSMSAALPTASIQTTAESYTSDAHTTESQPGASSSTRTAGSADSRGGQPGGTRSPGELSKTSNQSNHTKRKFDELRRQVWKSLPGSTEKASGLRTGSRDVPDAESAAGRLRMDKLESVSAGVFERFQPADRDTVLAEFEQEHLLVVTCHNRTLLSDVAWLIRNDSRFAQHETFRNPADALVSDIRLHQLVNWHKRQPSDVRTLSFMHIHDAQVFNSIRADIVKIHSHRAPQELKSSHGWIVLIVHPEAGWTATDQHALREIPVWNLPWLPALLHDRYGRCRELTADTPPPDGILAQFEARRDAHWPRDPELLCDDVMRYLSDRQEGYLAFVNEVTDRPGRQASRIEKPDLEGMPDLHREVLFLATFFPETPTPAFDRMLETLVAGVVHWTGSTTETTPAAAAAETEVPSAADIASVVTFDTNAIAAAPLPAKEQPATDSAVVPVDLPAIEYWKQRRQSVMRDRGVIARQDADGERVIDLEDSSRRSGLEDAFRNGEYLKERFERLRNSRLLFEVDSALPDRVARHLIAMNCTVAEEYRSVWGDHWLLETLIGKTIEFGALERIEALVGLIPQTRRRFFFDRFGSLCTELLHRERTAPFVTNLLVELVHTENLTLTADVVFPLLVRLRSVDTFDEFEWYRRVLNSGTADLRLRVEQQFLHKAIESQGAFWSMIGQMTNWHPPADHDEPTMHEQYALAFLFDFHIFWFHQEPTSKDAGDLPAHPLLGLGTHDTSSDEGQSLRSHADPIVTWLLHKSLPKAVRRIMGDRVVVQKLDVDLDYLEWLLEPGHLIADVIHSWSNLAAELKSDSAQTFVDALVESLRDELKDGSLRPLRREILAVWAARGSFCANETLQATDRSERTQLKQEKKRLSALRKQLRNRNEAGGDPETDDSPT